MSEVYERLLSRYDFNLPSSLIAKYPPEKREGGRLLLLQDGSKDTRVTGLPAVLKEGDLLVVNNTKVMSARIAAQRKTGGRVEVFITKVDNSLDCIGMIRPSRKIKKGEVLWVCDQEGEGLGRSSYVEVLCRNWDE